MVDRIETFGQSLIQHGPHNDRVYLMKLADADMPTIVDRLRHFAEQQGYGKIFAKIPERHSAPFLQAGFVREGVIPGFYRGEQAAVFLGFFLEAERQQEQQASLLSEILQKAAQKTGRPAPTPLPERLSSRVAGEADADVMAELYRQVFASYPFPIEDPAYLRQTMRENLVYFGVWDERRLIALSSAEIDVAADNAEMTDFATLPECRGRGIAQHLLQEMEEEMTRRTIRTLYTIARACSPGMNITFAKNGYTYSGTLTNNTNISGHLESMNLWYKPLLP
ncbi:MAG: putative beta-lysine N-acetyltransferase [Desulfuromonadales bacterium]|nr:putative beta-lysine N-acetyltransferase [Desulfuromonadales bacterium]